jgi:hypothetical protein
MKLEIRSTPTAELVPQEQARCGRMCATAAGSRSPNAGASAEELIGEHLEWTPSRDDRFHERYQPIPRDCSSESWKTSCILRWGYRVAQPSAGHAKKYSNQRAEAAAERVSLDRRARAAKYRVDPGRICFIWRRWNGQRTLPGHRRVSGQHLRALSTCRDHAVEGGQR